MRPWDLIAVLYPPTAAQSHVFGSFTSIMQTPNVPHGAIADALQSHWQLTTGNWQLTTDNGQLTTDN